jgi:hypothetical protein
MNLNGAIFVAIVINLTFGNLFPVLTVFCAGILFETVLPSRNIFVKPEPWHHAVSNLLSQTVTVSSHFQQFN